MASGDEIKALEMEIDEKTKAICCESIRKPAENVISIPLLSEIAHTYGMPVVADNRVPTPYLCRPFDQGADIVLIH